MITPEFLARLDAPPRPAVRRLLEHGGRATLEHCAEALEVPLETLAAAVRDGRLTLADGLVDLDAAAGSLAGRPGVKFRGEV